MLGAGADEIVEVVLEAADTVNEELVLDGFFQSGVVLFPGKAGVIGVGHLVALVFQIGQVGHHGGISQPQSQVGVVGSDGFGNFRQTVGEKLGVGLVDGGGPEPVVVHHAVVYAGTVGPQTFAKLQEGVDNVVAFEVVPPEVAPGVVDRDELGRQDYRANVVAQEFPGILVSPAGEDGIGSVLGAVFQEGGGILVHYHRVVLDLGVEPGGFPGKEPLVVQEDRQALAAARDVLCADPVAKDRVLYDELLVVEAFHGQGAVDEGRFGVVGIFQLQAQLQGRVIVEKRESVVFFLVLDGQALVWCDGLEDLQAADSLLSPGCPADVFLMAGPQSELLAAQGKLLAGLAVGDLVAPQDAVGDFQLPLYGLVAHKVDAVLDLLDAVL